MIRRRSPAAVILVASPFIVLGCGSNAADDAADGSAGHNEAGEQVQIAHANMQEGEGTQKKPEARNPLLDPKGKEMTETAPDKYKVKFETTKGDVVIHVTRDWSPHGADRFYNLVRHGYYNDIAFFRVVEDFMAQFGISGDPALSARWANTGMPDDPVKQSNKRGYITYAKTGAPNSRSTQLFINYVDNSRLDRDGFAPFGQVVDGMEIVDKLYNGYGDMPPRGSCPDQGKLIQSGNKYLKESYPKLDYLKTASIVEDDS
jgi:peptidyl-prolyl cis-trans isomerase A (cyclophilin A)